MSQAVFVSIEASSYSGATLLAFLLAAHPRIATVGEMNGLIPSEDPKLYLCSCGERIRECAFWQAIGKAMGARGFAFDVAHFDTEFQLGGPRPIQYLRLGSFRNARLDGLRDALFHAWPGERRRLRELVARNQAFVEAVLAVTGKSVFVDTSKDRMRLGALRRFSSLDIRAVHLVRDVRGVVASRLRRGVSLDAREAARQWARLHRRIEVGLEMLPEQRHIMVRYEDLCRDVHATLERIFRFCEVESSAKAADGRDANHHIVGNAMRLSRLSEIRLDERWRSLLTPAQLEAIWQAAGTVGRQYGYCREAV